jgi:hypothetical protein
MKSRMYISSAGVLSVSIDRGTSNERSNLSEKGKIMEYVLRDKDMLIQMHI